MSSEYLWKFGFNADIGTTEEPIWDLGGAYPGFLSAAATVSVASTDNVADNAAGTGALTVRVEGLDGDFREVSEDVTMNGQTEATTTQTFLRVHRAYVLTAGSGGTNAGTISVGLVGDFTTGVPTADDTYAVISAGEGQTLMAVYTVPKYLANGREVSGGWLRALNVGIGAISSGTLDIRLRMQENGGALRTLDKMTTGTSTRIVREYPSPAVLLPAESAIYISGEASAASTPRVAAAFALDFRWA